MTEVFACRANPLVDGAYEGGFAITFAIVIRTYGIGFAFASGGFAFVTVFAVGICGTLGAFCFGGVTNGGFNVAIVEF